MATSTDAPFWCPGCGDHNIENPDQPICDKCKEEEYAAEERKQQAWDYEVDRRIKAWKEDGIPMLGMRRRP